MALDSVLKELGVWILGWVCLWLSEQLEFFTSSRRFSVNPARPLPNKQHTENSPQMDSAASEPAETTKNWLPIESNPTVCAGACSFTRLRCYRPQALA